MTDPRLLILRAQLYTAAQTLKGRDLTEFWALLDEVQMIRPGYEHEEASS